MDGEIANQQIRLEGETNHIVLSHSRRHQVHRSNWRGTDQRGCGGTGTAVGGILQVSWKHGWWEVEGGNGGCRRHRRREGGQ